MGDRGQILINGVYLYTHYDASVLDEIVRRALIRGKKRWDDREYLARIIFAELIRDDIDGLLGYGIGTQRHSYVWRVIEVDCDKQLITDTETHYTIPNTSKTQTFEEFTKA